MLDSNEFKDIITVDFRLNTLGTKQNDIPVLCYYVSRTYFIIYKCLFLDQAAIVFLTYNKTD